MVQIGNLATKENRKKTAADNHWTNTKKRNSK